MKLSDRRLAQRFNLAVPLSFRGWRSPGPDCAAASVNVSESGVYFETDVPPGEGTWLQLRIAMPREITGDPATDWCCTGKVVRVQPICRAGGPQRVAVRFSYYEIAQAASQTLPYLARES